MMGRGKTAPPMSDDATRGSDQKCRQLLVLTGELVACSLSYLSNKRQQVLRCFMLTRAAATAAATACLNNCVILDLNCLKRKRRTAVKHCGLFCSRISPASDKCSAIIETSCSISSTTSDWWAQHKL